MHSEFHSEIVKSMTKAENHAYQIAMLEIPDHIFSRRTVDEYHSSALLPTSIAIDILLYERQSEILQHCD